MQFDYVIVGGGSAGATLAARLSEDPKKTVCLLEAGGEGKNLSIRVPALVPVALLSGKELNWGYKTVRQPALNNRRTGQPRGRGLGGSSNVNAMVYIRGHRKDYDGWADLGCPGWAYEDVLPYFRKSENNMRGGNAFHGDSGPLHVADPAYTTPISLDFVGACNENQIGPNDDFNGARLDGAGLFQVTQFHGARRGERCSAAAGYLHPVTNRPNLHVETYAQAGRILFEDRKAKSVEYRKDGETRTVSALSEVILCCGSFTSPTLLMQSGIGNAGHLKEFGITSLAHLPEVGENLQDHPDMTIGYKVNDTEVMGASIQTALRGLKGLWEYRRKGTGFWAANIAEAGAFFSVGEEASDWPDVQLHFSTVYVQNHRGKWMRGHNVCSHACILRPESRGTVTIGSADPAEPPVIDPGFLGSETDERNMLKAVKKLRQIMGSKPISAKIVKDMTTGHVTNDEELMDVIRSATTTIYHPVGTCRMGSDESSVVDTELRVRGVDGLRVVDASIMPRIVSGNTNAPTIMIAEKAADMIHAS
ncbi:GMC family oxidoreductase [Roseibium sp. RKSG952]|uniref:GMC family oxidoreductase n=1 Tax=Roseibium sp. RKSG952 TaxID=2529384 RepID=UPI0012BC4AD8|nr:GMC family oxidoreductase N-terminal domain-containing protein [Roseibium sp. RKSG952]MTI00423.1 glucose-methanol-choline oxidoreductase [Roseibium sp. RKSG952]